MQYENLNSPLGFAEFGMDRKMPEWVPMHNKVLHVGPGKKFISGAETLEWPKWDADTDMIPYPDNWFDGIVATHFMEHLNNPLNFLSQAWRVLRPGAPLSMVTPHGQSLCFLQDLDHKKPYVIDTWKTLLQNPYYTKNVDQAEAPLLFKVGANFLWGLSERNLSLVTQLIKQEQ